MRFSDINDPLIRFNDEFVAYCPGPNDPFGFRRLRGHVSHERIGRPIGDSIDYNDDGGLGAMTMERSDK